MHPIKLSIHWHGAAQDLVYVAFTYRTIYIYMWLLPLYMVKFKIIARHLMYPPTGWGKIPGDYDSLGAAIWSCRYKQEAMAKTWQYSIIVVEFDCKVPQMSWTPRENYVWLELTSEKPVVGGRDYFNAAQLAFVGGFDIGRWGECPTHTHPWSCVA